MDTTLNRCLSSAQAANVLKATANCAADDHECYKTNAQNAFQGEVNANVGPERKDNNVFMSSVGSAMAVAAPLTLALQGIARKKNKCTSASFWAMVAGSATLVIGDFAANLAHKNRLKKIRGEWGQIVNPESANGDKDKEREMSINAQSKAFLKLAEAEESMVKAAKLKKTLFSVAALAFTTSAVLATIEIIASSNPAGAAAAFCPDSIPKKASSIPAEQVKVPLGVPPRAIPKVEPATPDNLLDSTDGISPQSFPEEIEPLTGENIPQENDGLYAHYLRGSHPFISHHQFQYNLENSKDMASLIVNRKAFDEQSQPSIEYYLSLKEAFSDEVFNDPTLFETFKAVSIGLITNLNPVPSAAAQEAHIDNVQNDYPEYGQNNLPGTSPAPTPGQSSQSTSAPSSVKTNAAASFKEDEAKSGALKGAITGAAVGVTAGKLLGKNLTTSKARAIMSGVLAGWSGIMASHAASQAKASTKRAELLRKMEGEFASAAGAIYACKSEDRNDPAKPSCYCYNSENQRNPNRGNSKICNELWTGKNLKASSNYAQSGVYKVCIDQNQQADPSCKCKTSNSCMKVNLSGLTGLNTGTFSMISKSLSPVEYIANGGDPASINEFSIDKDAARMAGALKKLEQNPALKGYLNTKDKNEKALMKELNQASSGMGGGSLLGSSDSSGMPSNPGEAARMLEKEVQKAEINIAGGDISVGSPGRNAVHKTGLEDLEFGLSKDQLEVQENQIAEVMKKDLDFGGNDINPGSQTNIFDVLSNRYQRSGMRRLFDEKGLTQPEKAADTDIVK
jgi:hypothetical protein